MLTALFENKFIEVTDIDSVTSLKEKRIINRIQIKSAEFEDESTGELIVLDLSHRSLNEIKTRHPSVNSEEFTYVEMKGNGYEGKMKGLISYLNNSIIITEARMTKLDNKTPLKLKGFYISGYELS